MSEGGEGGDCRWREATRVSERERVVFSCSSSTVARNNAASCGSERKRKATFSDPRSDAQPRCLQDDDADDDDNHCLPC